MRRWGGRSPGFAAALCLLGLSLAAGCTGSSGDGPTGRTSSAIVGGQPSPASQDFVVELVHPIAGGAFVCSGSLVAPNLVLTARHCVSEVPDEGFTCDPSGNGTDGGALGPDFAPASIYVYEGVNAPSEFSSPTSFGAKIFHDGATNLCNHDLALLEISPPIQGVAVAALDLDSTLTVGQDVTAVGWGLTGANVTPSDRLERAGVPILLVGPGSDSAGYDVAPSEFEVGESVCSGDSGGPALDAANAVVGVVSRGGNDVEDAAASDPAATCVGSTTVNIYTETSAFRDLVLSTFAAVGSTPTLVSVAMGEACTASSECASGLCASVGGDAGTTCTQDCAKESCPGGFRCDVSGGSSLCTPAPSSGCSIERSASPAGDGWLACVVAGVLVVAARRRRRV